MDDMGRSPEKGMELKIAWSLVVESELLYCVDATSRNCGRCQFGVLGCCSKN